MAKRRSKKNAAQTPELKQEMAVVFTSPTGRAPWHPLRPDEVPDWVKDPKVMARLLDGEECYDPTQGVNGSNFYRAVRCSDINEATKADH